MKERPILFSGRMVRAILAGRKTQTRRVIKDATGAFWDHRGYDVTLDYFGITLWTHRESGDVVTHGPKAWCPYGQPGDRLYVRESWRGPHEHDDTKPRDIEPGGDIRYEADGKARFWTDASSFYEQPAEAADGFGKLRPGIFLPRWASRIELEITGVKVERLQDISEADVLAEGIEAVENDNVRELLAVRTGARDRWAEGWNRINGKRPGCSWEANPWLWCLTFKNLSCQNPNQG